MSVVYNHAKRRRKDTNHAPPPDYIHGLDPNKRLRSQQENEMTPPIFIQKRSSHKIEKLNTFMILAKQKCRH
jgi:hypothetical protein